MLSKTNKEKGYNFEHIAEEFLVKSGYHILARNFTIRGGEIDLIVQKENKISFVEVKGTSYGLSFQSYITNSKIKALKKTAEHWIYLNDNETIKEYSFDLILVENNRVIGFIESFLD